MEWTTESHRSAGGLNIQIWLICFMKTLCIWFVQNCSIPYVYIYLYESKQLYTRSMNTSALYKCSFADNTINQVQILMHFYFMHDFFWFHDNICIISVRREFFGLLGIFGNVLYVSHNCPDTACSVNDLSNLWYIFLQTLELANGKCQALLITRITHALVK